MFGFQVINFKRKGSSQTIILILYVQKFYWIKKRDHTQNIQSTEDILILKCFRIILLKQNREN